ncbi:MAG: glycosyltransferase, partial [Patescibacteria group bacterium]|nr:glycosyltransferase [Patescibacteria group bacterium]
MKIGIDARLIEETGVGRYIRNLLKHLAALDSDNEYVIFLTNTSYDQFSLPNNRWQKRLINVRWHTIYEQLILPFVFYKENLDVLHVPYFTVPLLYPKKIITTIHDLTILRFRTGKASTLPRIVYMLKWLAYVFVIYIGVRKSTFILTVSQSVKEQICQILHIPPSKIRVAHEGVDEMFFVHNRTKPRVSDPYFLYVGNV